ncbi:MAG: archaetidylserine decarboxylase [Wenzhouxiangellaceae bacterium]|nr:archaetidylserine decarboxylase [Wenzhouxiangellaceae bacterium]
MPQSTDSSLLNRLQNQETLNFWLTNRIPRNLLTRLAGRVSRIENRRLARALIAVWQWFADDLRLDEAETTEFNSLRDCFTRRLRPGARPIDSRADVLVSPCDAVVGAHGRIEDGQLLQAKGMVYRLDELLGDADLARRHAGGRYVTLRLKSSMYHHFHAPFDGFISRLDCIPGEVFNVNPPALKRIEALFCRNQRAVVRMDSALGQLTLVPVAAVLVSSMRFAFAEPPPVTRRTGPYRQDLAIDVRRGQRLGHFEHGSTVIVLAGPGWQLRPELMNDETIRMGRPLMMMDRSKKCPGAMTGAIGTGALGGVLPALSVTET